MKHVNDFSLSVATQNGSGSQSANNILVKTLFRMGLPVSGKNLFPSNIQGLPTWFSIRINKEGFLARSGELQVVIAMNESTIAEDIQSLSPEGVFIYNSNLKFDSALLRDDVTNIAIPFKDLVKDVTDSVKLKKLLINMIYVGAIAELIGVQQQTLQEVLQDQFKDKPNVIESNLKAVVSGQNYVKENLNQEIDNFNFKVEPILEANKNNILIDGNTASSLGLMYGGCTFMSWYPITPSSSLAEGLVNYSQLHRVDAEGKSTCAIVQAEDELSAISMVIGAGWAGARAITCTSGPGVSLMSEAAGLSYFAEIPTVIWDVQRGGPSTGLPTRTQQCDVLSCANLSHGDTEHVLLFPANPKECFQMGQLAFDLAERLQTLVFVLSDLNIGMNFWVTPDLQPNANKFDRGKVLNASQLEKVTDFARYKDIDGDGIPYRTLPGTEHEQAAYFTRGTGHDEKANYTENNKTYKELHDRLKRKFVTAKKYVPSPERSGSHGSIIGIIAYGSTDECIAEVQELLKRQHLPATYLRIKAYPFTDDVFEFIENQSTVYVIEQNRDGQLMQLLLKHKPEHQNILHSVVQYDGLPLQAEHVVNKILEWERPDAQQ